MGINRNSKGQFVKGSQPIHPFRKGDIRLMGNKFCVGRIPWNKGKNIGIKHPNWKGGKPKCLDCGKQLASYQSERCMKCNGKIISEMKKGIKQPWAGKSKNSLEGLLKGLLKQQNMKESTSIEKKVYDELKARGLLFEKQYLVNNKFLVDAYIPSLNLIIEADGDYWHSLPKVIGRDKAKNAYLEKCGFNLLRLSETEINNDSFKERLVF